MPMKCVVCGQLTDAEFRYERSQAEVAMVRSVLEAKRLFLDDAVARRDAAEARAAAAESALAEAKFSLEHECEIYNAACAELAVKDAALAEARGALKRIEPFLSPNKTGVPFNEFDAASSAVRAALARAGEIGRGSSTDRAPGRNPGDAGSSPAPSTPDEQEK